MEWSTVCDVFLLQYVIMKLKARGYAILTGVAVRSVCACLSWGRRQLRFRCDGARRRHFRVDVLAADEQQELDAGGCVSLPAELAQPLDHEDAASTGHHPALNSGTLRVVAAEVERLFKWDFDCGDLHLSCRDLGSDFSAL